MIVVCIVFLVSVAGAFFRDDRHSSHIMTIASRLKAKLTWYKFCLDSFKLFGTREGGITSENIRNRVTGEELLSKTCLEAQYKQSGSVAERSKALV